MLKIWGRQNSSHVQLVMWTVAELGLEYERFDIGHKFGGNDTPEFLAMNPNGTVPVLQDGDNQPLWESAAIVRYLANAYGDEEFWPKDPEKQAPIDCWAEWAKVSIAQNFSLPVFWPLVRVAKQDRDLDRVAKALKTFEKKLKIAQMQLEKHTYIAGDDFTLADIQMGYLLYRYYDLNIPRADLPAVATYYQQLTQRTTYREHVMISYEDLRAR